ncbi:MAG: CoB--CoM heterodisulfide reductase iron-sulfur subunit B family protein [Deltaproteobacteria bacterium]|nr:CoB--CoM heterodisulfide reductase iron-sulfur subunit B family protein [Deltaproteobacteria bacterium]
MKFALFFGCTIPARLSQYESSARAILGKLDVGLVDIREFNCCGYPLRNINFKAFVLLSARNLALAEKEHLNIMTLCQCCFGSLKKANHLLKEDRSIRKEVNSILKREGLKYEGEIEVRHLLQILYHEVGVESIQGKIEKRYEGLKIAAHYGCHVLRPSQIMQFDNPVSPTLFDQLVGVTGAESIYWSTKLDCCGAPLWGINDELSIDLTKKKLEDGKQSGADYLCVACPYCQIQFDTVQKMILVKQGGNHHLPSILYPQLLGLCMGIDREILGLNINQVPIKGIEDFLSHGKRQRGAGSPEQRKKVRRKGAEEERGEGAIGQ